jgi:nanoRNase/pAp phosphatase (c-di-AMP/oligoRNAs hydrolase)
MYGGGGHPKAGTFNYKARDIYQWMADHELKMKNQSANRN